MLQGNPIGLPCFFHYVDKLLGTRKVSLVLHNFRDYLMFMRCGKLFNYYLNISLLSYLRNLVLHSFSNYSDSSMLLSLHHHNDHRRQLLSLLGQEVH